MIKRIINSVLLKNKSSKNSLTVKRKEGYNALERITLIKTTSKEYCEKREKALYSILLSLSQQ